MIIKIIGWFLVLFPIIWVTIAMYEHNGWRCVMWIWSFTLILVLPILAGVYLLSGGFTG